MQQPKASMIPRALTKEATVLGCGVAHTQKPLLMADSNVWNAASFPTRSKRRMRIISAPMSVSPQRLSCIPRLRLPQNTKANPAIQKETN